jgi:hypothetical protein
VPAVSDHPGILLANRELPARVPERMGVGFYGRDFARHQHIQRKAMPGEHRFHAEPAIACDECSPDILLHEPGEQFPAAGIQCRLLRRVFLMPQKHCFGPGALQALHFSESFQNRPIANSHLRLDPWEIEHRLCESAVHVE